MFDYIEMKSGIKIPIILVFDKKEDLMLQVAPIQAKRLLFVEDTDGNEEPINDESEEVDNAIFFFADHFAKDEKMLKEIADATDIKVTFKHI